MADQAEAGNDPRAQVAPSGLLFRAVPLWAAALAVLIGVMASGMFGFAMGFLVMKLGFVQ